MASYYVYSAAAGSNNGSSWANAYTTLSTALTGKAAGDVFYVAHDHVEATAASISISPPGTQSNLCRIICVNRAGSVPPVSADRRATAQVTVTGGNNINFALGGHFDGIIFIAGSGASGSANINIASGTSGAILRFDNCSLRVGINTNFNLIQISTGSTGGNFVELNNTTISWANAGNNNNILVFGQLRWRNTPSALLGTIPGTIFLPNTVRHGSVDCIGVDFSAAGSGKTICGIATNAVGFLYNFLDCKLNAAVTKADTASMSLQGAVDIDFVRSGSAGVNYAITRYRTTGALDQETTIVRTGGASDGTTPIAWKVVTTSNLSFSTPFECPQIAIWNDTVGAAVTATVEGVWGGGAVPNDNDIWLEVEYLGDASSPQGSFVSDGTPDLLTTAAAQTSSTETWGGSTTKFKLGVTFTPQQKGWIYAYIKCAKAASTFYIDPLVTLT